MWYNDCTCACTHIHVHVRGIWTTWILGPLLMYLHGRSRNALDDSLRQKIDLCAKAKDPPHTTLCLSCSPHSPKGEGLGQRQVQEQIQRCPENRRPLGLHETQRILICAPSAAWAATCYAATHAQRLFTCTAQGFAKTVSRRANGSVRVAKQDHLANNLILNCRAPGQSLIHTRLVRCCSTWSYCAR